jgi:hypothetical protein
MHVLARSTACRCAGWNNAYDQSPLSLRTLILRTSTSMGCLPASLLTSPTLRELALLPAGGFPRNEPHARCYIPGFTAPMCNTSDALGWWAADGSARASGPPMLPALQRLDVQASAVALRAQDVLCPAQPGCAPSQRSVAGAATVLPLALHLRSPLTYAELLGSTFLLCTLHAGPTSCGFCHCQTLHELLMSQWRFHPFHSPDVSACPIEARPAASC